MISCLFSKRRDFSLEIGIHLDPLLLKIYPVIFAIPYFRIERLTWITPGGENFLLIIIGGYFLYFNK